MQDYKKNKKQILEALKEIGKVTEATNEYFDSLDKKRKTTLELTHFMLKNGLMKKINQNQ